MLTKMMPAMARALSGGMDPTTLQGLMQSLGNCGQPLEHRGPVAAYAGLPPTQRRGEYTSMPWSPSSFSDIAPQMTAPAMGFSVNFGGPNGSFANTSANGGAFNFSNFAALSQYSNAFPFFGSGFGGSGYTGASSGFGAGGGSGGAFFGGLNFQDNSSFSLTNSFGDSFSSLNSGPTAGNQFANNGFGGNNLNYAPFVNGSFPITIGLPPYGPGPNNWIINLPPPLPGIRPGPVPGSPGGNDPIPPVAPPAPPSPPGAPPGVGLIVVPGLPPTRGGGDIAPGRGGRGGGGGGGISVSIGPVTIGGQVINKNQNINHIVIKRKTIPYKIDFRYYRYTFDAEACALIEEEVLDEKNLSYEIPVVQPYGEASSQLPL